MAVELLERDLSPQWYDAAHSARIVGMDIETSGLDKLTDRIATVQMYVPHVGTVMVRKLDSPEWIGALLESKAVLKIFHHAPFDLSFLIRDMGIWPENVADTKIAARLVDPNKRRYINPVTGKPAHSLIALVHHYYGFILDKALSISNWFADELSPEQLDYAAKDVEFLPDLLSKLEFELSERGELVLARAVYEGIVPDVILESKNIRGVYGY